MKKFLRNNSLSIVFLALFIITLALQAITGLKQYNQEMEEMGGQQLSLGPYLSSGHFIEATFENWESEFLSVVSLAILSIYFR